MNNERFTFLKSARAFALTLLALCAMGVSTSSAQLCQKGNVTLDPGTCEAVVLIDELAPGATAFTLVKLLERGEHVLAADVIAPVNGGLSIVVSTPGTYKYEVTEGCWNTFLVEDKSGPKCIAGSEMPGAPAALPNIFASCTYDDDLGGKFTDVDASYFMDCSSMMDESVFYKDRKVAICGTDTEIPTQDGEALVLPDDIPDGWSVCEVHIREFYIADWAGNVSEQSNNCTQYLYVLIPTPTMPGEHVTGNVTHVGDGGANDCAESFDAPKDPFFTDLPAKYCGDGGVVTLIDGQHYCKWGYEVTEGDKIYTCTEKGEEVTYKQIRELVLIDWCGDSPKKQFLTQLVEVIDDENPDITPGELTEWSNPFECTVDVKFTASSAWDCTGVEMTGRYEIKVSPEHGGYAGGSFSAGTFDPATGFDAMGLSAGAVVTVYITAWDGCGNQVTEDYEYTIVGADQHAPVCISNDELFVSLIKTDHGNEAHSLGARVYPEDLDDSSYDNCGIATMQVRMPGGTWADYAEVEITSTSQLDSDNHACSTERWIELQITDNEGNTSVCKTLVVFTDNSVPVISAPADRTITCEQHPSFGTPDIWGFCFTSNDPVDVTDLEHCPDANGIIGFYSRTWSVTKNLKSGPVTRTATQKIYVREIRSEKFTFPIDYKMECVDEAAVADLGLVSSIHDVLSNQGCGKWVMNVEPQTFEKQSDACFKIIRKYTFINWCDWDKASPAVAIARTEGASGKVEAAKMVSYPAPTNTSSAAVNAANVITNAAIASGHFSYTQIIKVTDNVDPTGSIDVVVGGDKKQGDCHQATVTFTINATDACSDIKLVDVDITANTDYEDTETKFTQNGNVVTGVGLPAGTYNISVAVHDKCGNAIWLNASATVTKFDFEAPEVIGLATFTTMNEHCHVDVWLSDVLTSATDNCDDTDYEGLTFGMELANSGVPSTTMPTTQSVRITSAGVNTIALWAADAAGNTTWTLVPVNAANNDSGNCTVLAEGGGEDEVSLVGKVTNEHDEMVDEVTISASGSGFTPIQALYDGIFNFNVPMTSDVTVTPSKDKGHSNGVNTRDALVLQRHLIGKEPLTSAYQLIAADVTNNGSVSTQDLLHINRLTIGIYDAFPNVTSWRFVDKNHTFANPTSPWGFPESVDYSSLSSENQTDFIGIKIGDLTGNAKPSELLGSDEPKFGAMTIAVEDVQIAAGATQEIEFTAKDFSNFAGYQFTIQLAEGVTLEGIKVGDLPNHSDANFALNRVEEGVIATNWINADAVTLNDGAVLFTLTVSAANNINVSEAVAVNSAVTAAEAYNDDLETYDVDVQFNRVNAEFALYQNAPNPFSNETTIGFNLSEAGAASLKVMDVAGRVIKSINGTYTAGFHQISLNKSDLGATGVLYYQLDTDSHSATKKMVILE